jgi:hypothetical protein
MVLGHDFGSVVANLCALMRPDIFKRYRKQAPHSKKTSKLNKCPYNVITVSQPNAAIRSFPFNTNNPPALASFPEPRKHYGGYFSSSPANADPMSPPEDLASFLRSISTSIACLARDPKPSSASPVQWRRRTTRAATAVLHSPPQHNHERRRRLPHGFHLLYPLYHRRIYFLLAPRAGSGRLRPGILADGFPSDVEPVPRVYLSIPPSRATAIGGEESRNPGLVYRVR